MSEFDERLTGMPADGFLTSLRRDLASTAGGIAPTTVVDATRIGVLADTHCASPDDLPAAVVQAFRGVDLIVHCGDIGTPLLLERLAETAPVIAVRSPLDGPADGRVLFDGPRIIGAGDRCIGVVFHAEPEQLADGARAIFGIPVDLVVSGTTHISRVARHADLLAVDPGSPTLPARGAPTVAVLDLGGDSAAATIIELEA